MAKQGFWDRYVRPKVIQVGSLLFNDFDPDLFPPAISGDLPAQWVPIFEVTDSFLGNRGRKLILMGPWGVGKSTLVTTFLARNGSAKAYPLRRISFVSCHNLNDAFMHLISMRGRFFGALLFLVVAFLVARYLPSGGTSWVEFGIVLTGFVFFRNELRLSYIALSLIERLTGRKLVVLEDLDRSSLSESDQLTLLANLWPGHIYLVTYGYFQEAERRKVIDFAQKLNSQFIELPVTMQSIDRLARAHVDNWPFREAEWMTYLTARKLLPLLAEIRAHSDALSDEEKRELYALAFWRYLKRHLDIPKMNFSANGPVHLIRGDSTPTLKQVDAITSFLGSFESQIVKGLIGRKSPDSAKGSSNWMDIEVTKLLNDDRTYLNAVAGLEKIQIPD